MALDAAEEIAAREGLRSLTVRRIAAKIGYAPSTLYNLFENLDDLIVHLNGRILDQLYDALAEGHLSDEPEQAVRRLARMYIDFTRRRPKLWSLLFEHRLPDGQELPDWHYEKIQRLLALLERALAPLFPAGQETERHHSARVIWSSLHGICSLDSAGKLVKTESVEALAESLISYYLAGLARLSRSPAQL
jgi:AcrR family transcriptional regulator